MDPLRFGLQGVSSPSSVSANEGAATLSHEVEAETVTYEGALPGTQAVVKYVAYWSADPDDGQRVYKVAAGGQPGGAACALFLIPPERGEWVVLQEAFNYPACTTPPMGRGHGGALLVAACARVLQAHPDAPGVWLQDESYFPCPTPPRGVVRVPLHYHHALLYGQTWYQRTLGAEPGSSSAAARIALYAQRGSEALPADWEGALLAEGAHPRDVGAARVLVTGAQPAWRDMLSAVSARDCALFKRILQPVVRAMQLPSLEGLTWRIPRAAVEARMRGRELRVQAHEHAHAHAHKHAASVPLQTGGRGGARGGRSAAECARALVDSALGTARSWDARITRL